MDLEIAVRIIGWFVTCIVYLACLGSCLNAKENTVTGKKGGRGMTHQWMEIKIKELEKRIKSLEEQKSCEDAISRQTAIDAIETEQKKIMRSDLAIDQAKFSAMSDIREIISELPPVMVQGLEG